MAGGRVATDLAGFDVHVNDGSNEKTPPTLPVSL